MPDAARGNKAMECFSSALSLLFERGCRGGNCVWMKPHQVTHTHQTKHTGLPPALTCDCVRSNKRPELI